MYGYIYLTTCLINNKIYVGQHKSDTFDENYKGSGSILRKAFKKHGKKNFKVVMLCSADTFEELNTLEKYYIDFYGSTNREIGYNIKIGGNQTPCPQYIKDKISQANKGRYLNHVHLSNGEREIHVSREQVPQLLREGWELGRSNSCKKSLSEHYNYNSKGMQGKHQSDKQRLAASKACSYKRTDEQRVHFSQSKKVEGKYICLRTPNNTSTVRILKKNLDKYLALGYLLCNNQA